MRQPNLIRHVHAHALHGAVAVMAPATVEPVEQSTANSAQDGRPRARSGQEAPARPKSAAPAPSGSNKAAQKPPLRKPAPSQNPAPAKPQAPNDPAAQKPGAPDPSQAAPAAPQPPQSQGGNQAAGPESWGYTRKTAKLRIRVIDGRSKQPLEGAEVVLIETEQRFKTDKDGYTPWFDAPVLRDPRYRPMVAELHGQLGAIAYKNGYRDSIHLGIRVHEGIRQQTTIWMYRIGPADRRIEPVLYQEPYHHLWLIQLADKFRSHSQIGEGPERP